MTLKSPQPFPHGEVLSQGTLNLFAFVFGSLLETFPVILMEMFLQKLAVLNDADTEAPFKALVHAGLLLLLQRKGLETTVVQCL